MRTGGIRCMKAGALLATLTALLWLAPERVGAQQFKLGYVDANVIVQNMPEFKMVEAKMQTLRLAYEDTLRAMQAKLEKGIASYKVDVGSMTPEARGAAQAELNALQTQVTTYQNDRSAALAATQEQLLAPVRKRALEATEKVAREEKLAAVLDMSSLIYVDKKMNVNVTYKVLEYLSTQGN
jgi:outer membrane protein